MRERLIAHRLAVPLVRRAVGNARGRRGPRRPEGPIRILLFNAYGMGGTPEDPVALADTLLRVIEDEDLRARLGTAGRETARAYDPDAIGARWEALLRSHGANGRRQAVR